MGALLLTLAAGGLLAAAYYLKSKTANAAPPSTQPGPPDSIQSKFASIASLDLAAPILASGTGKTASPIPPTLPAAPEYAGLDIQSMFLKPAAYLVPPPVDAPIVGTNPTIEDGIARMATAIAHAEGYGIPDAVPTRANNPGDLKLGDRGNGTVSGKTVFGSSTEGWEALKAQIRLMWLDRSDYYGPDDTFQDIAVTWTGGDNWQSWLAIVSRDLGVSANTTLRGYLTGGTVRQ
jgi:hypothetical protein